MSRVRFLGAALLIAVLLFGAVASAQAQGEPPPFPSSFYGEIHVSDNGLSVGSIIEVFVPGHVDTPVATTSAFISGSLLVYRVDVPCETEDTSGGLENDIVTFRFNGRTLATGIFHSNDNQNVNFHPPAASAGGSYVTLLGQSTTFSAALNDWLTSDTHTYAWDLDGDGAYDDSTAQSPAYLYTTTGLKTVGLRITDSQGGQGTATATVAVITISGLAGQVYDGNPHPVAISGLEAPLTSTITYTGSTTPPTNAGSYAVVARIYNGASLMGSFTDTLVVAQRAASVTADAAGKVFGDTDPALTGVLTGFLPADGVSASYSRAAGEDAGAYTISATLSPAGVLPNYDIDYNTAQFTISPRSVTVTPDAGQSKVYGSTDPALTYTASVGGVTFNGALGRAPGNGVGTYAITIGTLSAGLNYTITLAPATFSITTRPITVTANAASKAYGDLDPAFTYAVTSGSLVAGDSLTGALERQAGTAVGSYAINAGTLTAGPNYNLTFVGANLTITTRAVTVTANARSKVYGDADPALTYAITSGNLVAGDNFSGALIREAGDNAGAYAIQQGTLALNSNYALTYIGATFTINPRPVTVTPTTGLTKVYGGVDPAFTYTSSEAGASFTGALGRTAGESVGSYAYTLNTLSAGSNYTITLAAGSFSITARPITVTAEIKTKVYGDPDPELTYQVTSGNLVAGDSLSGELSRAAGEAVGSRAILQNTLAAGPNYILTYVGANLTITARPVTVTADAKTKVYGDADPALTYQITAGGLAFSDVFTGALTREAGSNVGEYAIQRGTLALSSNYTLTYVGATFSITPKGITVTATPGQTKVYGNPDPVFAYTSSEVGLTFTGALGRATGNPVGTYAINQGNLSAGTNYSITFVPATFSITARPITVTAENKSKLFGAGDPPLTWAIGPGSLAYSDTLSGALVRDAGEAVGSYTIRQGSLAAGSNYTLTFVTGTLIINPAQHNISLQAGWNLVSFNLHPASTAIADVLASVNGNWDVVYAWDATGGHSGDGNWLSCDTIPQTLDTLNTLDETTGFWIHMTAADTLEIRGTFAASNITLHTAAGGWNLVGYPSASNGAMPTILTTHGVTDYTFVYSYQAVDTADPWKLYDTTGPGYANDLTTLRPGYGYWIYVDANNTWAVPY